MIAITNILYQGPSIDKASKVAIFLHGRGGTAKDMLSLANKLCDDRYHIIVPQANQNIWYPHKFMSPSNINEPYLSSSISNIKHLIDQAGEHVLRDQIYILGFSQGACLALEISSQFATKYGGIVAFTGGLIGEVIDVQKYNGNFNQTKVFISNSKADPYIPLIRSEESKELMEKMGANVTLKVYKDRSHTIIPDEINWVKDNILL